MPPNLRDLFVWNIDIHRVYAMGIDTMTAKTAAVI
jgi:hypothetical protein